MIALGSFARRVVFILATIAAVAVPSTRAAYGQTDGAIVSPNGPMLHAPLLLRNDAFALRTNPAALAWLDGGHLALGWSQSFDESDALPRVFSGVAAGGMRGFGLAFGADADPTRPRATAGRFGLALGSPMFSAGWSTHRWRFGSGIRSSRSHTLGTAARWSPVFGTAFVIHDINQPRLGGQRIARRWDAAMAVRSVREHVGLELGIRAMAAQPMQWASTLHLRPVDGLRIVSTLVVVPETGAIDALSVGVELAAGPVAASFGASADAPDQDLRIGGTMELHLAPPPQFIARRRALWRIDLQGSLSEIERAGLLSAGRSSTFSDLLHQLDEASRSDALAGVFLNLSAVELGPAQLWELREALERYRTSGRVVIAYVHRGSYRDLYLAGAADLVAVAPDLAILRTGLGGTRYYLGGLLDRLGIDAQFVRIGDYKSGPERFTESGPTDAARAQSDAYLDDTWGTFERALIADSGGDVARFGDAWAEAPLFAEDLVSLGLADLIAAPDALQEQLASELGAPVRLSDSPFAVDERSAYWLPPNPIAVLHINGGIVDGRAAPTPFIGGDETGAADIARAVQSILSNPRIRGTIVRITSPGGSASASEEIHRVLQPLRERMPVVVSMGDIAGSGGYYAAACGAPIYAAPTTLTGSIGIYAGTFGLDRLLARIGVGTDRVERGGLGPLFDGHRWSEEEIGVVRRYIEHVYALFLERVASARGWTVEEAREVGEGRIYSGDAALHAGLVDDLSGFTGALHAVRAEADIGDARPVTLVHYPEPRRSLSSALPRFDVPLRTPSVLQTVLDRLGLSPLAPYLWTALAGTDGRAMALMPHTIALDDR